MKYLNIDFDFIASIEGYLEGFCILGLTNLFEIKLDTYELSIASVFALLDLIEDDEYLEEFCKWSRATLPLFSLV